MELIHDNPPAVRPHSRRGKVLVAVAGVLALGALLAACGGGTSTSPSAPGATTTTPGSSPASSGSAAGGAATASQLAAFRACLTQQGVTLPALTPRTTVPGQSPPSSVAGGSGVGRGGGLSAVFTNPADQAAVTACASTLPAGYIAQQQARANQRAAFNSCMADHGVTVVPTTPGSPQPTLDTSSAAYKTCSPLLPARPQAPSGAASTTAPAA